MAIEDVDFLIDRSPGTMLHLRCRAATRRGQAAWSAPITSR
jgi:hypothetical protein